MIQDSSDNRFYHFVFTAQPPEDNEENEDVGETIVVYHNTVYETVGIMLCLFVCFVGFVMLGFLIVNDFFII